MLNIKIKSFVIRIFLNSAFLLTGLSAEAQDLPTVDKSDWTVAVSLFEMEETDESLYSIASLLSRLILNEIVKIDLHQLSQEEKNAIARDALKKKEIVYLKNSAAFHSQRDALFFDLKTEASKVKDIDTKIIKNRSDLNKLRKISSRDIPVPESLAVKIVESPDGELWDLNAGFPDSFRAKNNFDLLITGKIVRIGDYFGIGVYSWAENGKTVLWEGAADDDDIAAVSRSITSTARNLVLGRSWSSLSINLDPKNAIISVNGESVGVGYWADINFAPGPVSIEATAPGYSPKVLEFDLKAGDSKEVNVVLDEASINQILVRSIPTGATIRFGSLWLGRTPMALNLPDRVMPLTIEKEGFRTQVLPLAPDTARLIVPLEAVLIDPMEGLVQTRKQLYNSVAWFALSLAPTMVLMGIAQNYVSKISTSVTDAERQSAQDAYDGFTGGMWGSVAVNVSLLTVVLIRLSRFFKAAEELSDS